MAEKPKSADESSPKGDQIIEEARARFKLAEEAEAENRRLALDDLKFAAGEQWPDEVKNERARDGRPCLVINKVPQIVNQVTNDQRQNRPSIKVHPVDDHADIETAKVKQGLIRHIEYNSNADVAYDTAFESAAKGGLGYWRVITEYVEPTSFEQEILIKRIPNRFSVFFDPHSTEPDGSDANWCFIVDDVSKDEYKELYPESELSRDENWSSVGNTAPGWVKDAGVRIAEYFYKKVETKEICLLSDQTVALKEDLEEQGLMPGVSIVRERKAQIPVIKWCKLNGVEVLEETDWPGQWIPVVPVYGAEHNIDGKRILEGVIRNAKDPARMYNYWASAETEAIALAPRAPFLVADGQIEGFEGEWATANRRNHSYLTYKATDSKGNPVPMPQRMAFEPAVGAITQARQLAADDIKATTGIYDASLGARSNETSGIAIQRRNVQAQTSNFHFIDNLTRSLRHTGRILIDLIPKIYDTARTARIIGEDGEQKVVKLNQPTGEMGKDGKPLEHRLDVGKYDVTVDVGPSFATKRQEAVSSMLEVTRAYPQLAQIAGDLLVKNMDWPGAAEFAERIKKTLPPGLAEDPKGQQPIPPEAKQQMDQMGQMVEQLTAQLNDAQTALATKREELLSRERIEAMKCETQATIELAKLESKEALVQLENQIQDARSRLTAQIEELDARTRMLGFNEPMETGAEPAQQFAPQDDGAMSAEVDPGSMNPTGGETPGLPMEQSSDPNAF